MATGATERRVRPAYVDRTMCQAADRCCSECLYRVVSGPRKFGRIGRTQTEVSFRLVRRGASSTTWNTRGIEARLRSGHGVANPDHNEAPATMRALWRNRDVVVATVAQQLAALSVIEEHSGLVNSVLHQSLVSGAQS